ncbi:hypothetical protein XF_1974 [Xylella fastidiosa 9a5c]|uniref:Uncharacterized protein n=1 Tax=Xylella fastidiosa (strain 9a5c) TaxID=160492 RepID=Q9PC11_XYLFA|nr:hypothetical protein XF_1974 [Xylella fastidiosa 9a5c]
MDRDDFKMGPGVLCRSLLENGYNQLPIYNKLALAIVTLVPPLHEDAFDAAGYCRGHQATHGRCECRQICSSEVNS